MTTTNEKRLFIALVVVSVIALILALKSCEPTPALAVETKNTEIKATNRIIEVSKKEDIATIAKMRKIIDSITLRQSQSPKDKQKAKEFLKTQEKGEIGTYLTNYYKATDIITTNNGTEIGDNTGYKIVSNLIDLDFCQRDFKDLMVKYNALDKTNIRHYNLWQKSDTIANNNYKLYKNDSTALANVKEVKFRLLVGGGLGFMLDAPINKPIARVNIGVQVRNGKIYGASYQRIGTTEYILGEANIPIFSVKGKVKD